MNNPLYVFSEDGKTCRIFAVNPPRHWYNYLWNDDGYCAQVSQGGHGKSYTINERADMCRINGNSSRYLYLRDDETGEAWNIGAVPMNETPEDFCCEHSIGFTKISGKSHGVAVSWRVFVPEHGFHEVWTVTVQSLDSKPRSISLFSAAQFELEGFSYPRYYEMYRCIETRFDEKLNGIYCDARHPFAPHSRYNGFLATTEPVFAYDGDMNAFCGTASTLTAPDASVEPLFQRPEIVASGQDCTNSDAALFTPGAVLQSKLSLQPGEEKTLTFVLGTAESMEEARQVIAAYKASGAVEAACKKAETAYLEKYSAIQVKTPDTRVNQMMNLWVQKQIDFCIVGKKGVRDNLQIAVALLSYRPEKAKEEILECLRHQFRGGHTVLTWYPYDDTHYSDQPFWLIWAVCHLVNETGDLTVLDTVLPWQDGGEGTVLEHMKAAANRLIEDKGANGLCRIWFADWNDALNVTTDSAAESVMLTEQACLAFGEMEKLMRRIGENDFAQKLSREREAFQKALNDRAWDGDWYCRAMYKHGRIGSKDSEGNPVAQSGAEPMVFTNCYSVHPKYYGKSYQSWTTGTSAWAFRGLIEGMLGIRATEAGLSIYPAFPAAWHQAEMARRFRGADYHFRFLNPKGKEAASPRILADGVSMEGNILPDYRDGKRHEIVITF